VQLLPLNRSRRFGNNLEIHPYDLSKTWRQALEELAEAKLQASRELQAVRTDLKNAQDEYNSVRQLSLQKQSELQHEMNQLKMSNELREKDIERLNHTLSSEKALKDVKLQEIQQQLEDTINELEAVKSSKLRCEIDFKSLESEKKTLGERLQARYPNFSSVEHYPDVSISQLAIRESERYKDAVSNLETQAKLAESQISSIKNQLEQKTAQLDEAQVWMVGLTPSLILKLCFQARKFELISSQPIGAVDLVSRSSSAGGLLVLMMMMMRSASSAFCGVAVSRASQVRDLSPAAVQ
jgi:chromosome segregation ATPase